MTLSKGQKNRERKRGGERNSMKDILKKVFEQTTCLITVEHNVEPWRLHLFSQLFGFARLTLGH